MAPLRALIVDDEPLARRRLEILLRDTPDVEVAGMAADAGAASRMIADLAPDLVLLDIKMPGRSGFDVLDAAPREDGPIVIFVTAFDRYALEAFDRAAFDYLLKPVEPERLAQAIGRARDALAARQAAERVRELEEIVENLRGGAPPAAPSYERELWIQDRGDRISLPVAALDWVAAERDYVRLHAGPRSFLVRQPLGDLEARLDPRQFVRAHRSAVVRIDRIVRLRRAGGRVVLVLSTGAEIPVSRRHLAGVKAVTVERA
ncbi:LytTR family DNA-binding domain-containing protein [Phenylobacterium sp.]|jgi:DNA-binding LytR/AlgR family response regulator|uniref:LytR/AlgR family response regulator transcription factor n=1 Tax=Phenylobacterium sp. TaxID=1871053 RepID=UPI002F92851B